MELNSEQKKAFDLLHSFIFTAYQQNGPKRFVLGGVAGSGKTTLIKVFIESLPSILRARTAVMTPTGKSAQVLCDKGIPARTAYSVLLKFLREKDGKLLFFRRTKKEILDNYELIIVDEASMINKDLQYDIESFGIPVIYVGDHWQLPPVGEGNGIMAHPDYKLDTIMRQAEGSSIVRISRYIREEGSLAIPENLISESVKVFRSLKPIHYHTKFDQVLTGRNATRSIINNAVRLIDYESIGHSGQLDSKPFEGEKIMALKNCYDIASDIEEAILTNGQIGTFAWNNFTSMGMDTGRDYFSIPNPDIPYFEKDLANEKENKISKFAVPFCSAYAITVHKSQGSEWKRVALIKEPLGDTHLDRVKWFYTGVTRAREFLAIIDPSC